MKQPLYWQEQQGLQHHTAYQDKYSNAMQSMQYLNPISVSPDSIKLPQITSKVGKSMNLTGIGSIIDAGMQIGGAFLQDHFQRQAEKRANEEWDRRFDKENAYNHPSMQAKRLKQAGINPLGALSGSAPTPSASGSTNTPQSPSQQFNSDFAGFALSMQELKLRAKELEIMEKKADADIRNLDADTAGKQGTENRAQELHPLEVRLKELGIEEKTISNYVANATKDDKVAMSHQELNNLYSTGMKLIAEIANTEMDTDKKAEEIRNIQSEILYRDIQSQLARANISLTYAEVEQCFANISLMSAQELVALSENKLNLEKANEIIAITEGHNIENDLNRRYGGAQRVQSIVSGYIDSASGLVSSVADVLPWNALKNKNANLSKQVEAANKKNEQFYEHGYRDGLSSRSTTHPQYRKFGK